MRGRPVNPAEGAKDQIGWMSLMTRAEDVSPNVVDAAPPSNLRGKKMNSITQLLDPYTVNLMGRNNAGIIDQIDASKAEEVNKESGQPKKVFKHPVDEDLIKCRLIDVKFIEFTKFKKDASNGLSYEKMRYHIDRTHPRIVSVSKKSK